MTIENENAIAQQDAESVVAPVESPDDEQKPLYNKIQLSDVVRREKAKAYERGKQEALMQLQQEQQAMQQPESAPQQAQNFGGIQQLSPADIERMIAEKAPQMLQNHVNQIQNQQMVDSFVSKMQAAEAKYPGIQEKLNDLDYETVVPLIKMANTMDNTADIMHELMENPMKMGNLMTLMYTQPRMAQKAMMDLSKSIQTNQAALQAEEQARDPMSQLKPSQSAGMDSGAMSVTDFRKMFR